MIATVEIPTSTITGALPAITASRFSPRRGTWTSDDRPDAASIPRNATAASTAPNQTSAHSGELPRSIESTTWPGCHSVARPTPTITAISATLTSPISITRRKRAAVGPRMFAQIVTATAAVDTTTCSGKSPTSPQIAARYCDITNAEIAITIR
jgi:hypothetical protein